MFARHRRWAGFGYGLSALAALAIIGPIFGPIIGPIMGPITATFGRWMTGLGLVLSVPPGIAILARALHETRCHSGALVPVRRWGAQLRAFLDVPKLFLCLTSLAGALLLAKLLGLQIVFDQARWSGRVSLGPVALSLLLLVVFSLTFSLTKKHTRLALAIELWLFVCWMLLLGCGWWTLGGELASALGLVVTGVVAFSIGPAILRAPTTIDEDLVGAVDRHRAALASASAAPPSLSHPFRTASSIDRDLAYAVALDANNLPERSPSWFLGDWEAIGGSAGFVRGLVDALGG